MMKLAALATLAASAAAFAPAQTGKATTALNAFESELGAQFQLVVHHLTEYFFL